MERRIATPAGPLSIPAQAWTYALDHADSRRRGTPRNLAPITFVHADDDYVCNLNEDHTEVVVLRDPSRLRASTVRDALRQIEDEIGGLTTRSNATWDEADPDASIKQTWRDEAKTALVTAKERKDELIEELKGLAPQTFRVPLAELIELSRHLVVVGIDLGDAVETDKDAEALLIEADQRIDSLTLHRDRLQDVVVSTAQELPGFDPESTDIAAEVKRLVEANAAAKTELEESARQKVSAQNDATDAKTAERSALAAIDRVRQELGTEGDVIGAIADLKARVETAESSEHDALELLVRTRAAAGAPEEGIVDLVQAVKDLKTKADAVDSTPTPEKAAAASLAAKLPSKARK